MGKGYKIVNGVFKGPEVFKGDLKLEGTSVTSLGMQNLNLDSLSNLKSVRGFLFLTNSYIDDVSSLEEVGLGVITDIGQYRAYDLKEFKGMLGDVDRLTSKQIIERLPVEKSSFLKNILEHRLKCT